MGTTESKMNRGEYKRFVAEDSMRSEWVDNTPLDEIPEPCLLEERHHTAAEAYFDAAENKAEVDSLIEERAAAVKRRRVDPSSLDGDGLQRVKILALQKRDEENVRSDCIRAKAVELAHAEAESMNSESQSGASADSQGIYLRDCRLFKRTFEGLGNSMVRTLPVFHKGGGSMYHTREKGPWPFEANRDSFRFTVAKPTPESLERHEKDRTEAEIAACLRDAGFEWVAGELEVAEDGTGKVLTEDDFEVEEWWNMVSGEKNVNYYRKRATSYDPRPLRRHFHWGDPLREPDEEKAKRKVNKQEYFRCVSHWSKIVSDSGAGGSSCDSCMNGLKMLCGLAEPGDIGQRILASEAEKYVKDNIFPVEFEHDEWDSSQFSLPCMHRLNASNLRGVTHSGAPEKGFFDSCGGHITERSLRTAQLTAEDGTGARWCTKIFKDQQDCIAYFLVSDDRDGRGNGVVYAQRGDYDVDEGENSMVWTIAEPHGLAAFLQRVLFENDLEYFLESVDEKPLAKQLREFEYSADRLRFSVGDEVEARVGKGFRPGTIIALGCDLPHPDVRAAYQVRMEPHDDKTEAYSVYAPQDDDRVIRAVGGGAGDGNTETAEQAAGRKKEAETAEQALNNGLREIRDQFWKEIIEKLEPDASRKVLMTALDVKNVKACYNHYHGTSL